VIVVDTNVLLYLFIQGSRTKEAEAVLKRDPAWSAPWLWRSEFRNCLVGLVRQGNLTGDEAGRVIEQAERWMEGREYTVRSTAVLRLAEQSRCSAYDCEFVSVAQDLGVTLVTQDQQILRAFPACAVSPSSFVS
jgi:predicted nucleic acid-binding protein